MCVEDGCELRVDIMSVEGMDIICVLRVEIMCVLRGAGT